MKGPATGANLALNGVEIEAKTNGLKAEKPKETTLLANPYGKIEEALEKKLRNLEKRRQKQQQLKQELESGKALTDEQKEAILMINEVERQIEWIKEVQKKTQSMSRQFQRANKLRDEAARKNEFENTTEGVKTVVRFRELLNVLKKEDVNEEEWDVLDKVRGLIKPLKDFDSFAAFNSHLDGSTKALFSIVKGTDEEVFTGFTGSAIKRLLDKLSSSDFAAQLRFNNYEENTEPSNAQTQETVVERETVESSASPSLSTVSSHKTDTSRSQDSAEVSRQSPNAKRGSETPEEKVVFVANDSAQPNGTCEGQFVFSAEPAAESIVQNVPVVPAFLPGPTPVFVPVMTVPAQPVSGAIPPEMVTNVASTFVPSPDEQTVNTNGNYAQKNHRNRNGHPRNGTRGPHQNRGPGQQGNRPYRSQNSRDSNTDSPNTEPRHNGQRNGGNYRQNGNPRPNGGGYRGNRGGQPRDNAPPKPKYQYGFRFAETPVN